jgi:hypothetical protein
MKEKKRNTFNPFVAIALSRQRELFLLSLIERREKKTVDKMKRK